MHTSTFSCLENSKSFSFNSSSNSHSCLPHHILYTAATVAILKCESDPNQNLPTIFYNIYNKIEVYKCLPCPVCGYSLILFPTTFPLTRFQQHCTFNCFKNTNIRLPQGFTRPLIFPIITSPDSEFCSKRLR